MSKQAVSHDGEVCIVDTETGTYERATETHSGDIPGVSDAVDAAVDGAEGAARGFIDGIFDIIEGK